MATRQELVDQVAALKSAGLTKEAQKKEKELQAMDSKGKVAPATADAEVFDMGIGEDEFAEIKSGSDRPVPGNYKAELGAVTVDYSPDAMQFLFTITQSGPWQGFEDAFYSGKKANSIFKIKNICQAAGLTPQKTAKGTVGYNFSELPGRKVIVVYEAEPPKPFTGNDGVERMIVNIKAKKAMPVNPNAPKDLGIGQ